MPQTAVVQLQYVNDEVFHTSPTFKEVSPSFIYSVRKYMNIIISLPFVISISNQLFTPKRTSVRV